LARLSRSCSKSAASVGNRPQKTTGTLGLKPGSAGAGRRSSTSVSPIWQSATSLMPAVMKPISPGARLATFSCLGVKTPTWSTTCTAPVDTMRSFMPGATRPCFTRTRVITPR